MSIDLERVLHGSYPQIAGDLYKPYLDLLCQTREAVGGDLDKALILLAISVRTVQHAEFKKLTWRELTGGGDRVLPSLGTNSRSIAASVGIPRESVRRKIEELLETGWIVRQGRDLRLTTKGMCDLSPLRQAFEAMVARHFEVVAACLARGSASGRE